MNGPGVIAIVEDDGLIAAALAAQVESLGHTVCGMAPSAEEAVQLAIAMRPQVVLMDVRLSGARDGVEAALAIRVAVGSQVIFVTGSQEPGMLLRMERCRPAAILIKPVSARQLQAALERALAEGQAAPSASRA